MPAWIAGIQARKDALETSIVDLDSSTPCWNDANERALLEVTEITAPGILEEPHKEHKRIQTNTLCSLRPMQ